MNKTNNKIKGLDLFEAHALNIIPESGTLISGFYSSADTFRLEKTVYFGLQNAYINENSVFLKVNSGNQLISNVKDGKILDWIEKEVSAFESAPQIGRNFSFVFFPGTDMEERVILFIQKLLKFREGKK